MAGSNRKKQRKTKVSKGIHGSTRTPLTELQKALLGGGLVRKTKQLSVLKPWRGAAYPSDPPFDAKQVTANKVLYPHLFRED